MIVSVADQIRKLAFMVDDNYSGDSPYMNIPIYMNQTEITPPSSDTGDGPPSMYNDTDPSDRLQVQEDIRRQGERPDPVDWSTNHTKPVIETVLPGDGEGFQNVQGEPMNDTTTPDGRNENHDTIGFDPGTLTGNPFNGW